jgi:hypothetical protein
MFDSDTAIAIVRPEREAFLTDHRPYSKGREVKAGNRDLKTVHPLTILGIANAFFAAKKIVNANNATQEFLIEKNEGGDFEAALQNSSDEKASVEGGKQALRYADICNQRLLLSALSWWASFMTHKNKEKPNRKSPVTASVHTINYVIDDSPVVLKVHYIGTLHHITTVESGEKGEPISEKLTKALKQVTAKIDGESGENNTKLSARFKTLSQNCVSITSDIKRLLERLSGEAISKKVHFPWEMQDQLRHIEDKKLLTLETTANADGSFTINRNRFDKPKFKECGNDAAGLADCLKAYIAQRAGELAKEKAPRLFVIPGRVKLSAAEKVLSRFSQHHTQDTPLTHAEVVALKDSRLGMIISHYRAYGQMQGELQDFLNGREQAESKAGVGQGL